MGQFGVADVVYLLDVNVLVALLIDKHPLFTRARAWFRQCGVVEGWATCPMTELGAIRVCAGAAAACSPVWTTGALRRLCDEFPERYVWWPDALPPEWMTEVREAQTAKQVPDRYLLGLARRHRARLATFDRGLAQFGGATTVCLSPPRH